MSDKIYVEVTITMCSKPGERWSDPCGFEDMTVEADNANRESMDEVLDDMGGLLRVARAKYIASERKHAAKLAKEAADAKAAAAAKKAEDEEGGKAEN